jgi:hypothetical protein
MAFDRKITIDTVHGGDPDDQNALKHNYFQATGVNDTYQLFAPNGKVIPTDPVVLAKGYDFTFSLKEMHDVGWWVTEFDIGTIDGDKVTAKGKWSNTHKKDDDDGSFQAQAGGTTASASA